MKIKVSEAEGGVLDRLVNMADGLHGVLAPVAYSSNWSFGGPIIEREKIDITYYPDKSHVDGGVWLAEYVTETQDIDQFGPTPLIAAMRCFVVSRLGEEVEIPEELE